jgi:hypothetical protein
MHKQFQTINIKEKDHLGGAGMGLDEWLIECEAADWIELAQAIVRW